MPQAAVSITLVGDRRIQRMLDRLRRSLFSRAIMTEIGLFAMTRIKVRTVEGRDVHGRPFKPYSPKYKLFRQKHGRPVNKVDLTFTGSMLSSMTFDSDSNEVRLFFQDTRDRFGGSNPKKAFFLNEDREFFALSNKDVQGIKRIIRQYHRRLIS